MGYAGPSQFEKLSARENRVGDRLPWSHHVDDFTVATRDGTMSKTVFFGVRRLALSPTSSDGTQK